MRCTNCGAQTRLGRDLLSGVRHQADRAGPCVAVSRDAYPVEDGSAQRNLSNAPDGEGEPAWSIDGTRIAFVRFDDELDYNVTSWQPLPRR